MRLNFVLLAFIKSRAINIYLGTVAADEIFAWLRRYCAIMCTEKYKAKESETDRQKYRQTEPSLWIYSSEVG